MKGKILLFLVSLLLLTGCSKTDGKLSEKRMVESEQTISSKTERKDSMYHQIDQETAKRMMDEQDVVILDVREQDEYDSGHIAGAVLLPVGTISKETADSVIPEKDATVLVYCRSGNRSKTASQALADLGYTQIYEFGGIHTWQYETEQ